VNSVTGEVYRYHTTILSLSKCKEDTRAVHDGNFKHQYGIVYGIQENTPQFRRYRIMDLYER